jgi:hypothetical protein
MRRLQIEVESRRQGRTTGSTKLEQEISLLSTRTAQPRRYHIPMNSTRGTDMRSRSSKIEAIANKIYSRWTCLQSLALELRFRRPSNVKKSKRVLTGDENTLIRWERCSRAPEARRLRLRHAEADMVYKKPSLLSSTSTTARIAFPSLHLILALLLIIILVLFQC